MDLRVIFGTVLREQRELTGISQEQLAFQSDLDRTFISKLERGLNQPTLETIFTIANVFERSPSELIALVEDKVDGDFSWR